MADAHNCSSDAFCNNTHGSFACTCKPGYTGDGQKCTGNIYQWKFCSLMAAETSLLIIAMQRQGGSKGYGLGG